MLCKRKFKGCYGILISQWSDLKFAVNCLCVSSLKFSIWNCLPIIFDNFCAVLIGLLYRVLWWSNKWKLLGLGTFSSLSASAGLCSAANIWTIHDWSDVSRENTQAAARCAHCACLSSEQGGVCMRQRSARTLHNTQSWDYYALRARPVRLETSSVMTPMPFNPWYLDISSAHCFASTCDAPTYSQCGQQIDFGVETLLQTGNNKAREPVLCDGDGVTNTVISDMFYWPWPCRKSWSVSCSAHAVFEVKIKVCLNTVYNVWLSDAFMSD